MDFKLSELQEEARQTARDFAQKRLKPHAQKFDEEETIPMEFYREAGELGFFGMTVPEEYGGMGLDYVAYNLVNMELAKACAAFQVCISVHNSLAVNAIKFFGTDAQKKEFLPKMATGECIGGYSLSEPGSGTDAGSLKCAAKKDGDHYVLDGTKSWVSSASFANVLVTFVSTDPSKGSRGVSCLLVDTGLEGQHIGPKEKKMGIRGSHTHEISYTGCRVPASRLLHQEHHGFGVALKLLDGGRVGLAAQAVGVARAAMAEALSYAKQREQFKQPLTAFQAVQFKLARMAMNTDAAELLTLRAAKLMDEGAKVTQAASMAKLFASENANKVCYDALQIHGGNGYIREFPVERYYRDARVSEIYEGTSEIQHVVIARELLKG